MNFRSSDLDRYITGNYGEDQLREINEDEPDFPMAPCDEQCEHTSAYWKELKPCMICGEKPEA